MAKIIHIKQKVKKRKEIIKESLNYRWTVKVSYIADVHYSNKKI